ncbi:MAG: hypothetical protein Dbin4_00977, partial [Alphaproteobacteria bacterium]|nr:hypothetical protein [Alphaproteobacteria bacterium]
LREQAVDVHQRLAHFGVCGAHAEAHRVGNLVSVGYGDAWGGLDVGVAPRERDALYAAAARLVGAAAARLA